MKKLITITCLMLSMILFVGGIYSIYSIKTNNTDEPCGNGGIIFNNVLERVQERKHIMNGFILESDEDYNAPERVQERKEKMERCKEFLNTTCERTDK